MTTELLSPAGSLLHMQYAFAYGADAIYAGQPRYSLRVRSNSFDQENLAKGIEQAHRLGKKFYVVGNISPHNRKLKTLAEDFRPVVEAGPDAVIASDPGVIAILKSTFPDLQVHLSVQANAINYATVQFWQQVGVTRVILSRELPLAEIQEIHQQCPEMELEAFVHGALCMAHSGRCLLSGYLNYRDANQGTCTNACRWLYKTTEGQHTEEGGIEPKIYEPKTYLIEEPQREGAYMPMTEDEHGTYIMNSKDLCAIERVSDLIQAGVKSMKIEGRTKSIYYVARTAMAYRRAIDDHAAARPYNPAHRALLEGLANRGYTQGFLDLHTPDQTQNYEIGRSEEDRRKVVGTYREDGTLISNNKIKRGDKVELMTPGGSFIRQVAALEDLKGKALDEIKGSDTEARIYFDQETPVQDYAFSFLLQVLREEPAIQNPRLASS